MVDIYVKLIRMGLRTIEQVPMSVRTEVEATLLQA